MKKKDLLEAISEMSDTADLVISKSLVIDEDENLTAVIDLPIVGISNNPGDNEIRFLVGLDDIKHVFSPDDVTFID